MMTLPQASMASALFTLKLPPPLKDLKDSQRETNPHFLYSLVIHTTHVTKHMCLLKGFSVLASRLGTWGFVGEEGFERQSDLVGVCR